MNMNARRTERSLKNIPTVTMTQLTIPAMQQISFGSAVVNKLLVTLLSIILMVAIDDIATVPTLPDWGRVCVASEVRSGPDIFYPVVDSLDVGQRVRIHDQSRPNGNWVSIAVARWIPLKNICKGE